MSGIRNIFNNLFSKIPKTDLVSAPSLKNIGDVPANIVNKTKGDKTIWAIVIILILSSLLLVYSSTGSLAYRMERSTESYLFKQFSLIIGGLLIIYLAHRINYTYYSRIALFAFLLSIPLLVYTLFFGVQLNAGSRWIRLPVINLTFQTSDLAKLALFMFLSRMLSRKQNVIKDFKKGFLPVVIPVVIVCLFIAPANLSTAVLIFGTSMLLMFIGRVSVKHLLSTMMLAMIPIVFLLTIAVSCYDHQKHQPKEIPGFLRIGRIPTWVGRVQTFLYAKKTDDDEKLYQINQAKIAIANGGFLGKGPGNSAQRNFLPHCYSDFIYAIIIEEYGMVGAAFILFIYLVFLYRCILLYRKCPFAFGAFLALALSFTLVIQALTNMAVNVNLFPNTGVTLPLVSMGGSSFLFTCFSIGIILSVARNVEQLEGASLIQSVANEKNNDDGKEG